MSDLQIAIAVLSSIMSLMIGVYVYKKMFVLPTAFNFFLLGCASYGYFDIARSLLRAGADVQEESSLAVFILNSLSFSLVFLTYKLFFPLPVAASRSIEKSGGPTQWSHSKEGYFLAFFISLVFGVLRLLFSEISLPAHISMLSTILEMFIIYNFFLFIKSKDKFYLYVAVFFLTFCFGYSSRRYYITLFSAMYIIFMFERWLRGAQWSIKQKTAIYVFASLFFVFLNYLRAEHDYGEGYDPDTKWENTVRYMDGIKSIAVFNETTFILENFPERYNYMYGVSYASPVVGLIPRSVWPEKPVGFSAYLGYLMATGEAEFDYDRWKEKLFMLSLSPGFVGEAWANGGFIVVVLVSVLTGLFLRVLDNYGFRSMLRNMSSSLLYFAVLAPMSFLFLRGSFYDATVFSIYLTINTFILLKLTRYRDT